MSLINKESNLLINRDLNPNIGCAGSQIAADNAAFIEQIVTTISGNKAQLPSNPGFEMHPYKGLLSPMSQAKIIIGTFSPISYLVDTINRQYEGVNLQMLIQPTAPNQQISKPQIPFFHGNVSALWSVFLTQAEIEALNAFLPGNRIGAKNYLIQKLNDLGIYYDDIIKSTQRKLGVVDQNIGNLGYTYEDKNLKNICVDEKLITNVTTSPYTNVLCFTNGATFSVNGLQVYQQVKRAGLVQTNKCDAFSLFVRGCQELGLEIEMQCLPHFTWTALQSLSSAQKSTKLIFEIRITKSRACNHPALHDFTQHAFTVLTPFSPAAHGTIEHHPIVNCYRHINGHTSISNILRDVYYKFRNDQYAQLYAYNV